MPDQVLTPTAVARKVYRDVRQFPRIRKNPALRIASGKAQALLPVGETYRSIYFGASIGAAAATEAEVIAQLSLKLTLDGDTKIDVSCAELMAIQNFYNKRAGVAPFFGGIATADGVARGWFRLDFCRPWHREITGEDDPCWGTADVRSLELELSIGGAATIDGLVSRRIVTDGEPLGRHLCIRRKPRVGTGGAGVERVDTWKQEIGTSLLAIHVAKTTLRDVKLEVDNITEIDCEFPLLEAAQLQYERTPQRANGFSTIDIAVRNRLKDGIPMIAQTMNLDLDWSADPGNHTLLLEQIEGSALA